MCKRKELSVSIIQIPQTSYCSRKFLGQIYIILPHSNSNNSCGFYKLYSSSKHNDEIQTCYKHQDSCSTEDTFFSIFKKFGSICFRI